MSAISGSIGTALSWMSGKEGANAAKEAGDLSYKAQMAALDFYKEQANLARQDQQPFRQGGLWALEELIGTEGMQRSQTLPPPPNPAMDPRVAAPLSGYNAWEQAKQEGKVTTLADLYPKKDPATVTAFSKDPSKKQLEVKALYDKNKAYYDAMLPPGMKVGDLGSDAPGWLLNPYPIDESGQRIDTRLWKYGNAAANMTGQPVPTTSGLDVSPVVGGPEGGAGTGYAPKEGLLNSVPQFDEFSFDKYQESPWYTQPLLEGQQAMERSAIGRGDLYSGQFAQDLTKYGQDYGFSKYMTARQQEEAENMNTFNQWVSGQLNPRLSLMGVGQNAGAGMANNAMSTGAGGANIMGQAADARASGILGQAAAKQNMYSDMGQNISNIGQGFVQAAGMLFGGGALGAGGGGGGGGGGGNAFSIGSGVGGGAANDYGLGAFKTW